MRAPIDNLGTNRGRYVPSSLALIMDRLTQSDHVAFEAHLSLGDTSHSKRGYDLEVIVSTNGDSYLNKMLLSQFLDANIVFKILN
jgi:hypothetical protein